MVFNSIVFRFAGCCMVYAKENATLKRNTCVPFSPRTVKEGFSLLTVSSNSIDFTGVRLLAATVSLASAYKHWCLDIPINILGSAFSGEALRPYSRGKKTWGADQFQVHRQRRSGRESRGKGGSVGMGRLDGLWEG